MKQTIALTAFLSLAFTLAANDWQNWRGPNYNGATEAKGLPVKFSKTENIAWSTPMPGPSAATPIILGDRIFLTAAHIENARSGKGRLLAMCLDRKSGKILWERNAGSGYRPKGDGADYRLDNRTNYASPSPVTDGEVVVFFFGNGDLVAYTMKGDLIWRRNIQKDYGDFTFQWTFASTPTLFEDRLYLPVLQRNEPVHGRGKANNPSFILAMNPKNGETLWKHIRPSEANKESLESFGTIIPHNGELVIAGGDVLTGHDPLTGKEHWRWGTWNPGHREKNHDDGIRISDCDGITLSSTIIENSFQGEAQRGGAIEVAGSRDITISGCQVLDPRHRGIWLEDVTRCRVSNCTVVDRRTKKTMKASKNRQGACVPQVTIRSPGLHSGEFVG